MRIRSLRRFLTFAIIAVVALVSLITAAWNYGDTTHEIEELFDAQLAQSARVLDGLIDETVLATRAREIEEDLAAWPFLGNGQVDAEGITHLGHRYEQKLTFQIRDDAGIIVIETPSAPDRPLAPLRPGFARAMHDGFRWRTFTLRSHEGAHWIQVGQRDDIRTELAVDIAVEMLTQFLASLPLVAILVWWIVRTAFVPMRSVAKELGRRAPSNLSPVDPESGPREIQGLLEALNRLFGRLREAFLAERRFTADAAHELRTPLAALMVHAQNAAEAPDPAAARDSLEKVARGSRRLQHLVEQLLTLSRLDPAAGLEEWEQVDLRIPCMEQASDLARRAEDRGVTLETALPEEPALIRANPTMIGVLVRNLLENAIRHGPEGGRVRLSLERGDGEWRLEVTDEGAGIPAPLRRRVLERFYRVPGAAGEGSGLGLSIVGRVARIHSGRLELDDGPGGRGLAARVGFPAQVATKSSV